MRTIELSIRGMTCAACAARIEKKLNLIGPEVIAAVNFATETGDDHGAGGRLGAGAGRGGRGRGVRGGGGRARRGSAARGEAARPGTCAGG